LYAALHRSMILSVLYRARYLVIVIPGLWIWEIPSAKQIVIYRFVEMYIYFCYLMSIRVKLIKFA